MAFDRTDETSAPSPRPEWLLSTDERLLGLLWREGPVRPAHAAGVLGLHLPFVRRRVERLRRAGLLTEECQRYRVTDAGRTLIDQGCYAAPESGADARH